MANTLNTLTQVYHQAYLKNMYDAVDGSKIGFIVYSLTASAVWKLERGISARLYDTEVLCSEAVFSVFPIVLDINLQLCIEHSPCPFQEFFARSLLRRRALDHNELLREFPT